MKKFARMYLRKLKRYLKKSFNCISCISRRTQPPHSCASLTDQSETHYRHQPQPVEPKLTPWPISTEEAIDSYEHHLPITESFSTEEQSASHEQPLVITNSSATEEYIPLSISLPVTDSKATRKQINLSESVSVNECLSIDEEMAYLESLPLAKFLSVEELIDLPESTPDPDFSFFDEWFAFIKSQVLNKSVSSENQITSPESLPVTDSKDTEEQINLPESVPATKWPSIYEEIANVESLPRGKFLPIEDLTDLPEFTPDTEPSFVDERLAFVEEQINLPESVPVSKCPSIFEEIANLESLPLAKFLFIEDLTDLPESTPDTRPLFVEERLAFLESELLIKSVSSEKQIASPESIPVTDSKSEEQINLSSANTSSLSISVITTLQNEFKICDEEVDRPIEERDLFYLGGLFGAWTSYVGVPGFGLSDGEQHTIRADRDLIDNQQRMLAALKVWQRRNPLTATFRNLLSIVLELNDLRVAKIICQYISKPSSVC